MRQPDRRPLLERILPYVLPAALRARLDDSDEFRQVAGNIGWQAGDQLLRMGVGLLLGIWLARYLGPGDFGRFSYALAFVALFAPLAMLGLDDVVVRNLVRQPQQRAAILGTTVWLRLGGAALSCAAALAIIVILRPGDPQSWWLVGIIAAGGLFQAVNAAELWFTARVQARPVVLARHAAFLPCALGKALLILAGAPLLAFAWIALAECALGAATLLVACRAAGEHPATWRARRETATSLLRDSWALLLSCVIIALYLRIDQVMLGELAGPEAVGIYSVAVRLAEMWLFLSAAVYWSVLPGLVASRGSDEGLFYRRLQKYYNLMALCGYLIAVPVTLASGWLVSALFGPAYAAAGPMLAVLIWANLFIYLETARSALINAMNWYRLHLVTVALGALLNILLNLWLIPRYGGLGAALASCAAYWFVAHGSCLLFPSLHRTGRMLTRALLAPKVW